MAKRLALAIGILATGLVLLSPPSLASQSEPGAPFPIGNKLSRGIQSLIGLNAATGWLSSRIATAALRRRLGGQVKVKVHTYSLTDALAGKVKQVEVWLWHCSYHDLPLGNIHLTTANALWYSPFRRQGQAAGLHNALLVQVEGCLHEDDLMRALSSQSVTNRLRLVSINLPGMGQQRLQFLSPKIGLLPGQVDLESTVVTAGAGADTGIKLSVSGTPYIDGCRIAVKNLKLDSPDINSPDDFARFIQPLVNPLVDLSKLDRRDHAFRLTVLSVSNKKIDFSGNLVLAPKTSGSKTPVPAPKKKVAG